MFDHLKSLEVEGKPKWLAIPQVNDDARLKLISASADVNKPYQTGMLKMAGSRVRPTTNRGKITRGNEVEAQEDDRVLYPQYVCVGWEGILDTDGNEVEFNQETATEFFAMLPGWIFDRIRIFAIAPENFVDPTGVLPKVDIGDLSGNSESGSSGT